MTRTLSKLIDHDIYPEGYEHTDGRSTPEPENLDEIVQGLAGPRVSLSPSRFPSESFKVFKQANSRVISEGKVMREIIPIICGKSSILNEGNLPFTNLESITDEATVDAVPDMYDGSHPKDVHERVRHDLDKIITPTSYAHAPMAPNFFVEAKAPGGGTDVARRQACLDGAVGARAMHSLQNYNNGKESYDGRARAFSATYHDGTLKMYAHHMTGPVGGTRPEYHMTQLDGWQMTGNITTFRRGVAALRNARDMARQHRETLITAANARAPRAGPHVARQENEGPQQDAAPSSHAASQDIDVTREDSDEMPDSPVYLPASSKLRGNARTRRPRNSPGSTSRTRGQVSKSRSRQDRRAAESPAG